jgi:hypothetical protein
MRIPPFFLNRSRYLKGELIKNHSSAVALSIRRRVGEEFVGLVVGRELREKPMLVPFKHERRRRKSDTRLFVGD